MNVPFVDLQANVQDLGPELLEAIKRVIGQGAFILGDELAKFEAEFAAYCSVSVRSGA